MPAGRRSESAFPTDEAILFLLEMKLYTTKAHLWRLGTLTLPGSPASDTKLVRHPPSTPVGHRAQQTTKKRSTAKEFRLLARRRQMGPAKPTAGDAGTLAPTSLACMHEKLHFASHVAAGARPGDV